MKRMKKVIIGLLGLLLVAIIINKLNVSGSFVFLIIIGIAAGIAFLFKSKEILNVTSDFEKMWLILVCRVVFFLAIITLLFNVNNFAGHDILSLLSGVGLLFIIFYSVIMIDKYPDCRRTFRNIIIYALVFHASIGFTSPLW